MSPAEIRTVRQAVAARETTWMGGGFYIHIGHDGTAHINEHTPGETCKASVSVPRNVFAKMVEWYLRDQDTQEAPK